MKCIFVTIEEFLQNGGKLEKDREIYTEAQNLAGYYLKPFKDHHLACNASYKSFPVLSMAFYVKIEVTPIWK